MNKSEIQAKAAAIMDQELKHNIVNPYGDDSDRRVCSKCGEMLHFYLWEGDNSRWLDYRESPCTVPDPYIIDDSDACIGRAVVEFRKLRERMPGDKRFAQKLRAAWEMVSGKHNITLFKYWFMDEATALQIWEIVVLAKEGE